MTSPTPPPPPQKKELIEQEIILNSYKTELHINPETAITDEVHE